MQKFDYIIQNPPYNKNLHIQFFNKGLDILSDTGKMTIIEPAAWLMNLRQSSPNVNKLFSPLKERVKGRVEKIVIENLNGEFGTVTTVPFSITHINNVYNGQTKINGRDYSDLVNEAKDYINSIGGFEKFAMWGLC